MNKHQVKETNLTKNQSLVFGVLSNAESPLSAYSILDILRDEGFKAPLQVYRALNVLQKVGLIHRIECLNAFVACSQPDCGSHEYIAFAICEICEKVTEFSNDSVKSGLEFWAGTQKFQLQQTVIELRGKCQTCLVKNISRN